MDAMAYPITSVTTIYSTVYSAVNQRKHQSSASLAFVRGIHRWPVNSPHKWPITRQMFPFDDVIMKHCGMCVAFLESVFHRRYPPNAFRNNSFIKSLCGQWTPVTTLHIWEQLYKYLYNAWWLCMDFNRRQSTEKNEHNMPIEQPQTAFSAAMRTRNATPCPAEFIILLCAEFISRNIK